MDRIFHGRMKFGLEKGGLVDIIAKLELEKSEISVSPFDYCEYYSNNDGVGYRNLAHLKANVIFCALIYEIYDTFYERRRCRNQHEGSSICSQIC